MEKSQKNQGTHGGKRQGSGRKPLGDDDVDYGRLLKRRIQNYFSEEDIEHLIDQAFEQAKDKPEILRFLLEQIFGKARQNIGVDGGEEGKALVIEISEIIARKNGLDGESK